MDISTVASVDPAPLSVSASLSFIEEVGDLVSSRPELGEPVSEFIERVVRRPYDPTLVSACIYVNDANDFFRFRLNGVILFEWDTKWTDDVDISSVISGDWQVTFLKCRYQQTSR